MWLSKARAVRIGSSGSAAWRISSRAIQGEADRLDTCEEVLETGGAILPCIKQMGWMLFHPDEALVK